MNIYVRIIAEVLWGISQVSSQVIDIHVYICFRFVFVTKIGTSIWLMVTINIFSDKLYNLVFTYGNFVKMN